MQNCPKCRAKTDVYDTRVSQEGNFRRKRKCRGCGFRYATVEVLDTVRPLDNDPRVAQPDSVPKKPKPKPEQKRVKAKPVAKPPSERKVRRYDEDDYEETYDYEVQDVVRDLGLGDFT